MVLDFAKKDDLKNQIVLDLYGWTWTIGMIFAKAWAKQVKSVEMVTSASLDWKENAKLNWLLNWFVSYNQGDKEKTLWQELDDDIKTISERVNNITLKRAINEKGIIIDDRVVIYSALDWYSPWEVFLEIDWKIISRHK